MLLPRESNPSRPPVGRQNGGCWMPFEYANGGRQLCNSRPEPLGVGLGRSRRTPETCTCRSNIATKAEVPLGLARLLCGAGVARNRASRSARAGREGIRVLHLQEQHQTYHEGFKCKRCVFLCCPRCFNHFYFLEEEAKCPMCRL